jgi:hypothetical protein
MFFLDEYSGEEQEILSGLYRKHHFFLITWRLKDARLENRIANRHNPFNLKR